MPFPAALAASKAGEKANKILEYPVVGLRYKKTKHTKKSTKEYDASLQLRGWELVLAGGSAALIWYLINGGFGNGTQDKSQLNPLDPLGLTGPAGEWAWRLSIPGVLQTALGTKMQRDKAKAGNTGTPAPALPGYSGSPGLWGPATGWLPWRP